MVDNFQKIIFATLKKCKALLINNIVDAINPNSFTLFKTENGEPTVFKNVFDLQAFFRKIGTESLFNTLLILDHDIIKNSDWNELAEIFLLYPELKIKIFVERESVKTIFGIPEKKLRRCNLLIRNIKEFIEAGYAANNDNMLFDPSGIRNELKMGMIESIGFTSNNYVLKQKSRKENFGISIDYDPYHALFVGYALYNFGYSVIPVISYKNLEFLSKNKVKANLVCRECDLQFFDMKRPVDEKTQLEDFSDQLFKSRGIETDGDKRKIIKIRNDLYENILEKDNGVTWFVTQYEKLDGKKIWEKLKAEKFMDIKFGNQPPTENPFYVVSDCEKIEEKRPEFKRFGIIAKEGSEAALLRGQTKVIKGIYSLLKCPEVKRVYERAIDIYEVNRLRKEKKYHDKAAINLKFAREMVNRAKGFLLDDKCLESAVLACDAIELANGLSMTLSLEALHLKLQAETRLELMISGIGTLKETDLKEKIKELKTNVLRVCKKNDEAKRNTLIQYFNGLRLIYNEFEQFEAAETLYSEVSKIESGITRYSDQELNKVIEKATEKEAIKKNENKSESPNALNLSKTDKFKVILKTLGCNHNFWLSFILIISLALDCFMDSPLFPICYFGLFIGFCMFPKRAIYTIIGAGIDFRRFISSFLVFQVIMVFIYLSNYDYSKIPHSLNYIGSVQQKVIIITNTFLSSFINQPSHTFNLMMEDQSLMIHWLINFHMAITVIFLGIFISAVYRWITKR